MQGLVYPREMLRNLFRSISPGEPNALEVVSALKRITSSPRAERIDIATFFELFPRRGSTEVRRAYLDALSDLLSAEDAVALAEDMESVSAALRAKAAGGGGAGRDGGLKGGKGKLFGGSSARLDSGILSALLGARIKGTWNTKDFDRLARFLSPCLLYTSDAADE